MATSTRLGTAGVSINAGQAVFKDLSDKGRMKLATANGLRSSQHTGIALNTASVDQLLVYAIGGEVKKLGLLTPAGSLQAGASYFIKDQPAGDIFAAGFGYALPSGKYLTLMGIALNSDDLFILREETREKIP